MSTICFRLHPPEEGEYLGGATKAAVLLRDVSRDPQPTGQWNYLESYFPNEEWAATYHQARAIADTWYRSSHMSNHLTFEELDLGGALQWSAFCCALQILRDLKALDTLAREEQPGSLILPQVAPLSILRVREYDPTITLHLASLWAKAQGIPVCCDGPQPALAKPVFHRPLHSHLHWLRDLRLGCPPRKRDERPSALFADNTIIRLGTEVPQKLADYGYQIIVADRGPDTLRQVTQSGVNAHSWHEYSGRSLRRAYWRTWGQVLSAVQTADWHSAVASTGMPETARPVYATCLQHLCAQELPLEVEYAALMRNLTLMANIRVGVMCYSWMGYERLAVETFVRIGVPTLTVLHGLAVVWPFHYLPLITDYAATLGEADNEALVAQSVPAERLRNCGCPRFDLAYRYHGRTIPELPADKRKKVLVVGQASATSVQFTGLFTPTRELSRLVHLALKDDVRLRIIVRPHPADQITEADRESWRQKGIIVADRYHLYDWLNAVDVVLVQSSSVGLEALFFDKPLIVVNLTGLPDSIPFVHEGVAASVSRLEDLASAIHAALATPPHSPDARERFIRRYATALDGHATERVAALINEIAQHPPVPSEGHVS